MGAKLPAKTAKFTSLENLYVYSSYTMGMSGLPNMYTQSPRAEGVHIRQTTNAHGITVRYHIAPSLANRNRLKPESMQVCNPIVFIGKVVGIGCGFSLTGNFQCIYIYSKGYTL